MVVRPDLLEPDHEGFNTFRDVIDLVRETVMLDCEGPGYSANNEKMGCTPTPTSGPFKEEYMGEAGVRKSRAKPLAKEEEEIKVEYTGRSKPRKVPEII